MSKPTTDVGAKAQPAASSERTSSRGGKASDDRRRSRFIVDAGCRSPPARLPTLPSIKGSFTSSGTKTEAASVVAQTLVRRRRS